MTNARVITVASASGGCGKTFLATNLAWFLAHHGHRSVCVIDLDLRFGEVGTALRLRPVRTIADVIGNAADADGIAARLTECCAAHTTGIHVIAAPVAEDVAHPIGATEIRALIAAAREHFDEVVIDTPPTLSDTVVEAIDRSDIVIALATPDVPSLRNLRMYLGTLDRLQVPTENLRLLLNKVDRDAGVDVHDLLATFHEELDGAIPFAREVERSTNAGRPVLVTAPGAEVSLRLGDALRNLLPDGDLGDTGLVDLRDRPRRVRRWLRTTAGTA